ncbi:hypothetical protein G6F66_014659 [Rhizopus arrhizus]|nr:hypothetical protein G6F66_014659 [Rhizopus arrhizus]
MPTVLVACALGVFAYASGNVVFANYLQIPQIPGAGELVIICAAIAGAGLGFLWFHTYPAMVVMGAIGALRVVGAAVQMVGRKHGAVGALLLPDLAPIGERDREAVSEPAHALERAE